MNLLTCYNPEESIVLGERYGYGVRTHKGYNYITGGGGTIISRRLLPSLATHCLCPSARTPDDMYLGFCLRELGTEIVHSPLFHQVIILNLKMRHYHHYLIILCGIVGTAQ